MLTMVLHVQARCTGCGETFEAGYEVPLETGRSGGLRGRKTEREAAAALRRAARAEGWAVSRSQAYCPHCAEMVAKGSMPPAPPNRATAAGYVDGLLLARALRRSARSGERRDG